MGTRADFYIGRGESAEWIGSIGWDGYPEGLPDTLQHQTTEAEWRAAVEQFFATRKDVTRPSQGWPWPWETSQLTDYAYAFDDGVVYASCFGHDWFKMTEPPEEHCAGEKTAIFPNMKDKTNVTLGPGSGLIVIGG